MSLSTDGNFHLRESCPVCGSASLGLIYEKPYSYGPIKDYLDDFYAEHGGVNHEVLKTVNYTLYECKECLLIFQRAVPTDEMLSWLYDGLIDPEVALSRHRNEEDIAGSANCATEIMQIIDFFSKPPSSLKLLDFGMGWGRWALMAKAFGCDIHGFEVSEKRLENATLNGINVVTWDEMTSHGFDFINTEQVLEHLADPMKVVLHLKSALKPGGILKISVPTANDLKRRLKIMDWRAKKPEKNSLNPVSPLEHVNYFSRKSLAFMGSNAGLSEIHIPLAVQYRYVTNWSTIDRALKNILLPIYRNLLEKQNYILLRSSV